MTPALLRQRLIDRQLELIRRLDRAYLTGDGRWFCSGRIEQISEILEWLDSASGEDHSKDCLCDAHSTDELMRRTELS